MKQSCPLSGPFSQPTRRQSTHQCSQCFDSHTLSQIKKVDTVNTTVDITLSLTEIIGFLCLHRNVSIHNLFHEKFLLAVSCVFLRKKKTGPQR